MPRSKLPFRSSSVKVKGPGLFSRTRNNGSPKSPIKPSSASQRHPPPNLDHGPRNSELQRVPVGRDSRSHDSSQRPPPQPTASLSQRGRSPPRRRSTYRSSLSPPSHRNSPRDEHYGRPARSPPRRRYSSSEVPRPGYLSPNSAQHPPRRADSHDRRGRQYSAAETAAAVNDPRTEWSSPSRHKDRRYPPSSSSNHRPQSDNRVNSPHPRPSSGTDRLRPHSTDGHGRRSHPSSVRPSSSPLSHSGTEHNGHDGFLSKFPKSFVTYAGLRALAEHADKAKEWAEWFNNVNGAPEEIRNLSSRVSTARDTIKQIQESLEARPDLIEDEAGQILKLQIEDAIEGTSDILKRMTELLSSFNGAAQQDGTALGRLEGFWHSFNYKNSGEEQVRNADAELQQQMTELSTLMSNIFARALKSPSISSPGSVTPNIPTPVQATTATTPLDAQTETGKLDDLSTPHIKSTKASRPVSAPTTNERPLSPHSAGNVEENAGLEQKPVSTTSLPTPPQSAPSIKATEPSNLPQTTPSEANSAHMNQDARDILLDAVWDGDLQRVANAVIQAHPNSCDLRGLTAIHLAAERDHMAVAMFLLDCGADIHARADGGCMPLHLAARYASAATVDMLIDRGGADVNARTTDGRTALHYAARSAEDGDEERREVIRTLRDLGANPTLCNRRGETPRDAAQKRDYWDAAATLRRAEQKWEEAQLAEESEKLKQEEKKEKENRRGNWLQRHGFMKK